MGKDLLDLWQWKSFASAQGWNLGQHLLGQGLEGWPHASFLQCGHPTSYSASAEGKLLRMHPAKLVDVVVQAAETHSPLLGGNILEKPPEYLSLSCSLHTCLLCHSLFEHQRQVICTKSIPCLLGVSKTRCQCAVN